MTGFNSSRQRMLAALNREQPDHTPCSFMLFNGLKNGCDNYIEFLQRQLDLGLDVYVQLPPRPPLVINDHYNLHGLPVSYHPDVTVKEWKKIIQNEPHPILFKEYYTPSGVLRTEVRQTEDWRWGDHVPFLDDYLVPRSRKFIVEGPEDLAALAYLLVLPSQAEIATFHAQSAEALAFARQHDLLVAGGWGVGADLVGWVYGLQQMLYALYDQPEFIQNMLDLIARWNIARMSIVLDADIDLFIKRAWYETCDFFTPRNFRKFLAPILSQEIELVHHHGAKFGYLITSNCMPLLGEYKALGIDVLIGVDPACWDLVVAKKELGGSVCIWGGVNGHLTVEQGLPETVRTEVRCALKILAPGGGLILSPVDNVREYSPAIQKNVHELIDEWKALNGV